MISKLAGGGVGIFNSNGSLSKTVPADLSFTEKMAASGDGKQFAIGTGEPPPTVRIINLETGKTTELDSLKAQWRAPIRSVEFSPDGRFLAVVTNRLIVIDLAKQAIVFQHTPSHGGEDVIPTRTVFSPSGNRLAWSSPAGTQVISFPPTSGTAPTLVPEITGHYGCLAFSPSGNRLAGTSGNEREPDVRNIRIVDLPHEP